jgi:8-oxo-dGTP diphosphatase
MPRLPAVLSSTPRAVPDDKVRPVTFRYCPHCATELTETLSGGRRRPSCPTCGYIQYRNPTVGVAVVLLKGDSVLLGRRAHGSSYAGRWCFPCGHVEWDEDVREAAVREFAEETGLHVRLGEVLAVHSNVHNPQQHTVGIWFDGFIEGGELLASDDLDQVDYFPLTEPFPKLAFPTDEIVLNQLRQNAPATQHRKAGYA